MAMDKLKTDQARLCELLSRDPDYILKECGDILLMNQYRTIEKESCAFEKMQLLLNTVIQTGENTCQNFVDILCKHKGHYPQLRQVFEPNTQGSHTQHIAYADSNSIISDREIKGVKGKSFTMKTKLVSGPYSSQSGNFAGQNTQANYSATGGSVICSDKLENINVAGDIDLSVTITPSHVHTGGADETRPSSQEPDVKMIREHKTELISCLMGDCSYILQHVQTEDIITDREYQNLKETPLSENTVIDLIDLVMNKGPEFCSHFLEVLKKPDILSNYPQLKKFLCKS